MLIILIALALSGLAQAQLPSNLTTTSTGFVATPADVGKIHHLFGAGEYDVVFHNNGSQTLSVFRQNRKLFEVRSTDSALTGLTLIPPSQANQVTLSTDGKKLTFVGFCNPKKIDETLTIYQQCSVLAVDLATSKVAKIISVGDTVATVRDAFGVAKSAMTVKEIRSVPQVDGDKIYGAFDLRDARNVSYGGLYEIRTGTTLGATGLVADTTPGHYFVGREVYLTPDKKGVVYTDSRGGISGPNDAIRLFTFGNKASRILLSTGDRIGNESVAGMFINRYDYVNRLNYVTAPVSRSTISVSTEKPTILSSPFSKKLDGVAVDSNVSALSNGLVALPYRFSSSGNWWEHTGIAIVNNDNLLSVLKIGDVVGSKPITGIGEQVAPHRCSVTGIDLDPTTKLYSRLVTSYPVFVRSLTVSSDGKTAKVTGCGLNLEGTTLDSLSIGGATAEVVRRGVDPDGYDFVEARPLSPVYGGQNEVAVTVNGRRFASTISVDGPARPKIEIVNAASFEPKLAPQTLATLRGTDTGKAGAAAGVALYNIGGANVLACGQPARLLYNSGTSINFLVPKDVELGECEVVLFLDSREIARTKVELELYAPAIFTFALEDGTTLPIASHNDENRSWIAGPEGPNTLPASVGQVVTLWLTGAGPTFPEVQDSTNTPQDGLYRCVNESGSTEKPDGSPVSPIVKIGGVEAKVHFCGLAPNSTGLYQINVEVPAGTVPGDNYLWVGEDKDGNPLSPIYKLWTR